VKVLRDAWSSATTAIAVVASALAARIQRVAGAAPRSVGHARRHAYFRPDTPNDQWIDQVFVAGPAYDFPVFVRLELFNGEALMSFADTPPIAVKR
jgi:hypothetical protein